MPVYIWVKSVVSNSCLTSAERVLPFQTQNPPEPVALVLPFPILLYENQPARESFWPGLSNVLVTGAWIPEDYIIPAIDTTVVITDRDLEA